MSDYETIQRRRNITVGIFTIAALIAITGLIYKFGDLPWFVTRHRSFQVFVQFPSAPGVQRDTPVRFCGYQIGRVTKVMSPEVRLNRNTGREYHQTVVVLSIKKKHVDIPSNVEAKLMTRGLGSSYIELTVDPEKLPAPPLDPNRPETRFLVQGTRLQGSTGIISEFFPEESQKKLDELANGLKSLVNNVNCIIGDPNNKENLKETLANLAKASQNADEAVEEFRKFAAAGTKTFTSIVETSEELSKATSQLRLILEKVNNGDGSAARFVNDGRLYESMLENTQQIQMLLEELKSFIAEARDKGVPLKLK